MAVVPFTLVSANALGSGTFTMPSPSGVIRTGTTVGDTLKLQAYDTDTGPAYTDLLTLTAGTTPSMTGLFGAGTAATPTISFAGDTDTGLSQATGLLQLVVDGSYAAKFAAMYTIISSGKLYLEDYNTTLSKESNSVFQLGLDAAGTTAYTLKGNDRITSDGVGGDLTIAAGRGLGAASGSLYFQVHAATSTGVAGTLVNALTIAPTRAATFENSIYAKSQITATGGVLPYVGRSVMNSVSNGTMYFATSVEDGFTTLNLGPTTGNTANATTVISKATATLSALSGATVTATNLIPAGSLVLGVSATVSTLITGATSFAIGDGTDVDRWGTGIAVAAGTKTTLANITITSPVYYTAATSVVLTAAGSNFTAGEVKLTVHYISTIAQA